MNPLVIALIVLAVMAVVGLLVRAVPRLKRAARWVDATLQDAQHAPAPAQTDTTDPNRLAS